MTFRPLNDRIYGCLYGGAIGDALGLPVEFKNMETIRADYGQQGIQEPPDPALYSDDTQMTLRTARGLLDALEQSPANDIDYALASSSVAKQYVLWEKEDPYRAPGLSCLHGVAELKNGVSPLKSGKPDSKGCGAVMRSAPYGIITPRLSVAANLAGEHALMTHQHQAAQASAAALAAGIWAILDNQRIQFVIDVMALASESLDPGTAYMIDGAAARAQDPAVSSATVLDEWRGWCGDEAIAAAVYCWIKHSANYPAVVRLAANSPGDSDSLAAIAGNLAGAWLGVSNIPSEWMERIENASLIANVGHELIQARKDS